MLLPLHQLCIFASIDHQQDAFTAKEQFSFSFSQPFNLVQLKIFIKINGLRRNFAHPYFQKLISFDFLAIRPVFSITPLQYALIRKNIAFIQDLFKDGVDLNECGKTYEGKTDALTFAICCNFKEMVNELLCRGAHLDDMHLSFALHDKRYDFFSDLNSILNVVVSLFMMGYYSFTKGYQNISSKDLRFFAFGEKQQIENIFDEIENQHRGPVLTA